MPTKVDAKFHLETNDKMCGYLKSLAKLTKRDAQKWTVAFLKM